MNQLEILHPLFTKRRTDYQGKILDMAKTRTIEKSHRKALPLSHLVALAETAEVAKRKGKSLGPSQCLETLKNRQGGLKWEEKAAKM